MNDDTKVVHTDMNAVLIVLIRVQAVMNANGTLKLAKSHLKCLSCVARLLIQPSLSVTRAVRLRLKNL